MVFDIVDIEIVQIVVQTANLTRSAGKHIECEQLHGFHKGGGLLFCDVGEGALHEAQLADTLFIGGKGDEGIHFFGIKAAYILKQP